MKPWVSAPFVLDSPKGTHIFLAIAGIHHTHTLITLTPIRLCEKIERGGRRWVDYVSCMVWASSVVDGNRHQGGEALV